MNHSQLLIIGGGIGGLAAALAGARAGHSVRLLERASAFSEVGAGIQLGPNVTRLLHGWGLGDALASVAAFPARLVVRSALSGAQLGVLPLGRAAQQRYGAPYATLHRADLHGVLLQALQQQDGVQLDMNQSLLRYQETADGVAVRTEHGVELPGAALIGADGLWSRVREQLLGDGAPRASGHWAYRALLRQAALPLALRSQDITVWLGPKLHLVQYPVRGGDWLNVALIVQQSLLARAPNDVPADVQNWNHDAHANELRAGALNSCSLVQALLEAVPDWRRWALCDRAPLRSAQAMARGRVALLGDAAHPMLPYLAQGAGMALEDAACLGGLLQGAQAQDLAPVLTRYAEMRWQRNARVQKRATRNGTIFHMQGVAAWGRDKTMQVLGQRVLDLPWLYGGA